MNDTCPHVPDDALACLECRLGSITQEQWDNHPLKELFDLTMVDLPELRK